MNLLSASLLILNLGALAWLASRHLRLRAQLEALRARSDALAQAPAAPPELVRMAQDGAALLSVQILNPMELAAQRHWLAGLAGRITPGIVRGVVCREAARIIGEELPKYGVVAEVKVVSRA